MGAAFVPDEGTNFVATNRQGHGWQNQKLAHTRETGPACSQYVSQQPILWAI